MSEHCPYHASYDAKCRHCINSKLDLAVPMLSAAEAPEDLELLDPAPDTTDTQCDHCGAPLRKYWHTLTPGMVSALTKFRRAVHQKNANSIHLRHDMDGTDFELERDEWTNFTKLRYHGLAVHHKDAGKGYWLLTKRGAAFLRNELAVPKRVQTFRNSVIDHDPNKVMIGDITSEIPRFEYLAIIDFDPITASQAKEMSTK